MLKSANGVQMFGDVARRKRYFYALLMILLMIGAAELLMEREIIFPEMAALTIGMCGRTHDPGCHCGGMYCALFFFPVTC